MFAYKPNDYAQNMNSRLKLLNECIWLQRKKRIEMHSEIMLNQIILHRKGGENNAENN